MVEAPDLEVFGWGELSRMVAVTCVLGLAVAFGLLRSLAFWRGRSALRTVADSVVAGFFRLGPTYVKIGQIFASSPGLFPADVADAAQVCLAEVPPFGAERVREMIEADLGVAPGDLFDRFDDEPLSAGSVGQVHSCRLTDGREAVVKVSRPNVAVRMNTDLRIALRFARLAMRSSIGRRANIEGIVRDLHEVTNAELNATLEAHRQDRFRTGLWAFGDNAAVMAPEVFWNYCGPNVICMERIYGVGMDDFQGLSERTDDPRLMLRRSMKAWLESVIEHGPFHGDVHAGNVWALDDGRVAFLDFGIMGELTPEWRQMVRDILQTLMVDGNFGRVIAGYRRLGVIDASFGTDEELAARMGAAFAPIVSSQMGDLHFGELFLQSMDLARELGDIVSPQELTLIGKQFLYFERYVKGIAPDYLVVSDPYLIKNIFPDEALRMAAKLGVTLPD